VTGALGISGPVWRLSLDALQAKTAAVRAAAARLSEAFGHVPIESPPASKGRRTRS
jgi:hypothetical protein